MKILGWLLLSMVVIVPVAYLYEHAYSFRQKQQIACLQESCQRMREVVDSLTAALGSARSPYAVEEGALALGMAPIVARRPLQVPSHTGGGEGKAAKTQEHKSPKTQASEGVRAEARRDSGAQAQDGGYESGRVARR